MKKILIITHNFPPESVGGASRIYEMAIELQKYFEVEVICAPPTYPFKKYPKNNSIIKYEKLNGLKICRIWTYQPTKITPSFFQRFLYYTLFPIIVSFIILGKLHCYSMVIVTNPPPTLLLTSFFIKIFKKKLVIDIRDFWIDAAIALGYVKNKSVISLLKKFEKYCIQKSDLLITNSLFIYDDLKKLYPKKKLGYIPFNVNLSLFQKKDLLIENHLIYIGNIGPAQNLENLIQAVSIIISKIPTLKVKIFGGGDNESDVKKLIKELHLTEHIVVSSPIPRENIPDILSKSLIGIIPLANKIQLRYAIPTKTFEYFACGLPVFAYGYSDELQRIIRESKAGLYVKDSNPEEIAKKLIQMLEDKQSIQEYSINARKFVEKHVDFSIFKEI